MTNEPAHWKRDEEFKETASLLSKITGGSELLEWFGGIPDFGDGEIVSLVLDRKGQSRLNVRLDRGKRKVTVTFVLQARIDVAIRAFSHQNVVGGINLRPAGERQIEKCERGVGCTPGELELELEPCFGVYGTIRASIASISIAPLPRLEWMEAEFSGWAGKHLFYISRSAERPSYWSVYLSSEAGECFVIWMEPITDEKVRVCADYVEGPKNPGPHQEWIIEDIVLPETLEAAYHTVHVWMAPSSRYFPPR